MSTKKKEEKNYNSSELILVSIGSTILLGLIIFVIIYGLFIYKTDSKTKKWNIFFSRIVNYSCTDNTICTTPTVYTNSTSTGIFSVEFKNSDQSAVYEVTVKNDGILDAELTSVILSTPNCIGNADNEESANNDAETVCNNLSYKLTDIDGNTIIKEYNHDYNIIVDDKKIVIDGGSWIEEDSFSRGEKDLISNCKNIAKSKIKRKSLHR